MAASSFFNSLYSVFLPEPNAPLYYSIMEECARIRERPLTVHDKALVVYAIRNPAQFYEAVVAAIEKGCKLSEEETAAIRRDLARAWANCMCVEVAEPESCAGCNHRSQGFQTLGYCHIHYPLTVDRFVADYHQNEEYKKRHAKLWNVGS